VKVGEFIQNITGGKDFTVLREEGYIEEQDILGKDEILDRRTVARLMHIYMKKYLGLKDPTDISQAYCLRDLFDCRICAQHIAVMYVLGIMKAVKINDFMIFDSFAKVEEQEADNYIKMMLHRSNMMKIL
jgi:hypothetical protein